MTGSGARALNTIATAALALLIGVFVCPVSSAAQEVVRYPNPESSADKRAAYPVAVLKLCSREAIDRFEITPTTFHAQQERNIRQLAKGEGVDVIWAVGNAEREKLLLPIRIPIDRGLIGWRLLLIRQQDRNLFDTVTRDQLATLYAGQGHDWPDVDVLRANHLRVSTSTTYEGLFKMLAKGHIQYFPRSISEIWPELAAHEKLGLEVQGTLALHYPQALYFFVRRDDRQLARQLTNCLEAATGDGSLRRLFYEYYRDDIAKADLPHRTVIELTNPYYTPDSPTSTHSHWFTPGESQ